MTRINVIYIQRAECVNGIQLPDREMYAHFGKLSNTQSWWIVIRIRLLELEIVIFWWLLRTETSWKFGYVTDVQESVSKQERGYRDGHTWWSTLDAVREWVSLKLRLFKCSTTNEKDLAETLVCCVKSRWTLIRILPTLEFLCCMQC